MTTNTAYIKTEHLNAILFPNRNDCVTPELRQFPIPRLPYIEKLFGQKIMFFGNNFSEDDDLSNTYTPLEVRSIVCDKNRTCMYLVFSDFRTGVQIPGGSITRDDIENPYVDKEAILISSLTRNILTQLDSDYGESIYESIKDELVSPREKLGQVLQSKFGKCEEQPELYFSYILPNTPKRKFIFYYVYECEFIKDINGLALPPRGIITLHKELFRISLRQDNRTTASNVIGFDPIEKGVVFEDYGRAQLSSIFNTKKLF